MLHNDWNIRVLLYW